jgi:hypothetical protein
LHSKSTIHKLAFPSPVRVCDKCFADAQKGGKKQASAKQYLQEFYKQHPRPLAIKAPPPPSREEVQAEVGRQVDMAEKDARARKWAAVVERYTLGVFLILFLN